MGNVSPFIYILFKKKLIVKKVQFGQCLAFQTLFQRFVTFKELRLPK